MASPKRPAAARASASARVRSRVSRSRVTGVSTTPGAATRFSRFRRKAPRLAAVLILDDGAREWRRDEGEAAEIAELALGYVEVVEET